MEPPARIIFIVIYVITMIASLFGNILLIYIVWKKPEARSLTSFMFVNNAVADLLVTLVVIPYSISNFYMEGVWLLTGVIGEITCKAVIYVAFFTISTSILCLTFMAVDRFYAVVYPFRQLLWFRRPKVLTPVVWLLSMALMSIVPVFIVLQPGDSNDRCKTNFGILGEESRVIRAIYIYFFVINYLLPVSVISVLYTITARKLWFHKAPGDGLIQNHQRQQQTKRKVVRMLIIVFTAFALCWLPGQVFQLYYAVTGKESPIVETACLWFGHNNSAINPWLYIGLNSKIHRQFTSMMSIKSKRYKSHALKTENKEMSIKAKNETCL